MTTNTKTANIASKANEATKKALKRMINYIDNEPELGVENTNNRANIDSIANMIKYNKDLFDSCTFVEDIRFDYTRDYTVIIESLNGTWFEGLWRYNKVWCLTIEEPMFGSGSSNTIIERKPILVNGKPSRWCNSLIQKAAEIILDATENYE